jgi:hypothetical protein
MSPDDGLASNSKAKRGVDDGDHDSMATERVMMTATEPAALQFARRMPSKWPSPEWQVKVVAGTR